MRRFDRLQANRVQVKEVKRPVGLGQFPPGSHYAPAIKRVLLPEELYDNRKERKR